jgi:hypothetical protein
MAATGNAIKKAIEAHTSVEIVKTKKFNYLNGNVAHPFSHYTDYYVGVKVEGIPGLFRTRDLNHMLQSMIPDGLTPATHVQFAMTYSEPRLLLRSIRAFLNVPGDAMTIGHFTFVEQIGLTKLKLQRIITDADLKDTEGFTSGNKCETLSEKPLLAQVRVMLFPNTALATMFSKDNVFRPFILLNELSVHDKDSMISAAA